MKKKNLLNVLMVMIILLIGFSGFMVVKNIQGLPVIHIEILKKKQFSKKLEKINL